MRTSIFFCLLAWLSCCQADVIVLIHGLGRHCGSMSFYGDHFKEASYTTYCLNYDSQFQKFNESLNQVNQELAQIKAKHPSEKIHFIGHSLGGLLSFRLHLDLPQAQQGSCTTLGSPYLGSPVALWLGEWAFFRFVQGPVLIELQKPFISELEKSGHFEKLFCVAGNKPSSFNLLYYEEQPNDGMVTVASAIPNDAWNHLIVPRSHNGLLYDKDIEQAILQHIQKYS